MFILRIPVRYYRQPPVYFRGWQSNAPPRWGQHWGQGWEQRRKGWDHWKRSSVPARAPLPVYQRQYTGERYPRFEQQQTLRSQNYRYQPRNKAVREQFRQIEGRAPEPAQRRSQNEPHMKAPRQQDIQHATPVRQGNPTTLPSQPTRRDGDNRGRPAAPITSPPAQQHAPVVREQRQPAPAQQQQQVPGAQRREERPQERGRPQESQRDHGQGERRDGGRGRD